MKRWFSTVSHCLVILSIGLVIYYPALSASFHLDDSPSIRDNAAIRHLGDLRAIWAFWPTRFVTYCSLALNFHFSQLNPLPYHAANVAIHLLNAILVYLLCRRLFPARNAVPFLAALVFLCHPLQTQGVTYVVQRATSLASFFYLLSVLLYVRSMEHGARSREAGGTPSPGATSDAIGSVASPCPPSLSLGRGRRAEAKRSCICYILSLFACLAAMLTKEFAATLPIILVLMEWLVVRDATRTARFKALILLPFLLATFLIPSLVYFHRDYPCYNDSGQIEWAKKAGFVDTVAPGHGESPRTYLLTQPRVFLTYLRLVFFPAKQRVEYDFNKNISFFQTSSFLPSLLILSLAIFALARRRNIFIISFGILWFIVTLIPESSVIPILDVCVEHRLYLPLAGAAILAGSFLESIASRGRAAFPFAFAALFLFSLLTCNRNLVWHDPITLWEDNAAKAEGKARVHGNLGKAYLDAGRFEKAAREFKRMIELDPTFVGAYNNLAVIYIDHLKDYEEAKKYIALSLSLFPDYPAGYLNLGVIYLNTRQLKLAIENFKKVLDLDPKNLLAHYNLAACYVNLGDFTRAEEYLRRGLSFWPEEARFYALLARICRERGDIPQAEEFERKAGERITNRTARPAASGQAGGQDTIIKK
ncbi:MAG: tetratricopeptide repeat protein [Candidatus Aureabacteria bacterium]|nr:tetratricopeptide repeat protein [Candidatus Auribacterota bacterium]